jgi:uncharacterized protein (TIGR03067 family)
MRSFVHRGVSLSPDEVAKYRLTVRGGKYVLEYADHRVVFTVCLDANRSPKEVEWTDGAGNTLSGIYELTGDTLRVCRAAGYGLPRPERFSDRDGALVEWERVQGKQPGPTPA